MDNRLQRFIGSRFFFPFLLFLILTGFYWKLTLTKQFDWVWGPDLAQQVIPWYEEEARQLQHSEIPLWDPHTWGGQPMLGQAQPGTAYPLNWLLFLTPRTRGHIGRTSLQWYFILIHFMAALFCFLLCRDLKRSRAASLIAALIFSLATYIGTTDWPQMINGAVWSPLVFLFLLRVMRGLRPLVNSALCGSMLGMAWLAGHHQVPMYTTLAMSGTWLYFILRERRINWNLVKLFAVVMLFLVLVGALQILPAQEYGHLAKRWAGADHELSWDEAVPYYVHREYSMYPMSLFAILIPGMARHADPFVGVVALSLALLAIALAWKNPYVRLFGIIAVSAIVYSLGHNSVFHGFLYAIVPMVEKARVPSMAVCIWGLGIAVLASFGADHFAEAGESVWTERAVRWAAGLGIVLYGMILLATFINKGWGIDDRSALTALFALMLAGIYQGWRTKGLTAPTALTLLTLLMLMELGNVSGYAFPHTSDKDMGSYREKVVSNPDIANWLHQQPGPFRVEADTEALVANWGSYYNFDVVKALNASVTVNVLNMEFHTWQTRMLFGVRYSVADKPPMDDSHEVFTGQSGLKVWENPTAFPRAWAVHDYFHIDKPDDGRAIINDHVGELRFKAFTLGKPAPVQKCSEPDNVTVTKYAGEKVTLKADMACDGLVVVSDTYFPGWKVTIDGKPGEIQEVDLALRGIPVPKGSHTVVMAYRPASVYLGAFLTLAGWLAALGLYLYGPRKNEASDFILT